MHAGYRALLTWINVQDRAACDTRLSSSTCRAASSRELGLPAIVGTGDATRVLHDEQEVTVSCAEGDEGFVYDGCADYEVEDLDLFQNQGLTKIDQSARARLMQKYRQFEPDGCAREIVSWLNDEYRFDPNCLTE